MVGDQTLEDQDILLLLAVHLIHAAINAVEQLIRARTLRDAHAATSVVFFGISTEIRTVTTPPRLVSA